MRSLLRYASIQCSSPQIIVNPPCFTYAIHPTQACPNTIHNRLCFRVKRVSKFKSIACFSVVTRSQLRRGGSSDHESWYCPSFSLYIRAGTLQRNNHVIVDGFLCTFALLLISFVTACFASVFCRWYHRLPCQDTSDTGNVPCIFFQCAKSGRCSQSRRNQMHLIHIPGLEKCRPIVWYSYSLSMSVSLKNAHSKLEVKDTRGETNRAERHSIIFPALYCPNTHLTFSGFCYYHHPYHQNHYQYFDSG